MQNLLEHKLRINRDSAKRPLYQWCLNEVGVGGEQISGDWIPFLWRVHFRSISIEAFTRVEQDWETDGRVRKIKSVKCNLISGDSHRENSPQDIVKFSILGTSRTIQKFTVYISEANESHKEGCYLTAVPSYESENEDFIKRIEEDFMGFDVFVSPQQFQDITRLAEGRTLNSIYLSAKGIPGLYAHWSPTIKPREIKILTEFNTIEGADIKNFEGSYVGRVEEFSLTLSTNVLEEKKDRSIDDSLYTLDTQGTDDLVLSERNTMKTADHSALLENIFKNLRSVKIALWLVTFLLFILALK